MFEWTSIYFLWSLCRCRSLRGYQPELIEHLLAICNICNESLRIIKREIQCPVFNKHLTRNESKLDYINSLMNYAYKNITIEIVKTVVVWLHKNILNKKIIPILNQYRKRACKLIWLIMNHMKKNQRNIANKTGAKPHRSTLFYYHKKNTQQNSLNI